MRRMSSRGRDRNGQPAGEARRIGRRLATVVLVLLGGAPNAVAEPTPTPLVAPSAGAIGAVTAAPATRPAQYDDEEEDEEDDWGAPAPTYVAPTLLGPDNGLVGTLLKPTFSWRSTKPEWDVVVLAYRSGNAFHPYWGFWTGASAWVEADDLGSLDDLDDALEDKDRATGDGLVTVEASGDQGTARIERPLEPGRYAWYVVNGAAQEADGLVVSEQREFTVHGPTLERLRVSTRPRRGKTTQVPGWTEFRIATTRFADIRIELRRGGRKSVMKYNVGNRTSIAPAAYWSCKKPGGRYRYRVVASDSHGKQMTKSGTFRPVGRARCRALRNQEQRAKAARQREIDRRVAERRRAEAAAERRRVNRYKSNCRKLGGTPELMRTSEGNYWVCVAPWGGTWIDVPY
jgi:putative hemolysin